MCCTSELTQPKYPGIEVTSVDSSCLSFSPTPFINLMSEQECAEKIFKMGFRNCSTKVIKFDNSNGKCKCCATVQQSPDVGVYKITIKPGVN